MERDAATSAEAVMRRLAGSSHDRLAAAGGKRLAVDLDRVAVANIDRIIRASGASTATEAIHQALAQYAAGLAAPVTSVPV